MVEVVEMVEMVGVEAAEVGLFFLREYKKLSGRLLSTSCILQLMICSEGYSGPRSMQHYLYVCSLPCSGEDLKQQHTLVNQSTLCARGEAGFHSQLRKVGQVEVTLGGRPQCHPGAVGEDALEWLCRGSVHAQVAAPHTEFSSVLGLGKHLFSG